MVPRAGPGDPARLLRREPHDRRHRHRRRPQGEQWRLGEADDPDHVVLQVTDSRIPCSTFQWRMREPRWVRRFADHGEPGAYLSVVKEGVVRAGAVLEVVQVPEGAKTIREQFAEVMGRA